MKEQLSSQDLLTARFRHKKSALSFAIIIIAFLTILSSSSFADLGGDNIGGEAPPLSIKTATTDLVFPRYIEVTLYDDLGDGGYRITTGSGGTTSPAGSDTQVQFNDSGSFGGDSGFIFNKTSNTATVDIVSVITALQVGSDYISDITGSGLSIVGGVLTAAGGSGDAVTVNSTAIDTTANIKDSTDITYAITDGGAGGPDDIAGTVVNDSHNHTTATIADSYLLNTGDTSTGALTINDNDGVDDETMLTIGDSDDLDNLIVYGNVGIGTTGPGALLDIGTAGTSLGKVRLSGNTSGNVTLQPNAVAGTDIVLTLPATTGTLVTGGGTASGTNTGDNTVATTGDSATSFFSSGTLEVAIGGTGTTTSTGTGAVVLGTSPALTTPNLGAVAAGSTWSLADTITTLSIYTGTTSLEETTGATDSGGYIVGLFDEFAFSAGTDVQTVLDDLDNSIPDNYQYTLLPESSVLDDNNPPAITVVESSGTATPRFRVADFDGGSTNEILYWSLAIPDDYNSSGTITADVYWFTAGTSGNARWGIQVSSTTEADTTAITAQAADSENGAQEAANGTANRLVVTTVTLTNNDSLTAGDDCVIVFYRDASDTTNDTLTNDARLLKVLLKIPRT